MTTADISCGVECTICLQVDPEEVGKLNCVSYCKIPFILYVVQLISYDGCFMSSCSV